jgi:hypothetical protein
MIPSAIEVICPKGHIKNKEKVLQPLYVDLQTGVLRMFCDECNAYFSFNLRERE